MRITIAKTGGFCFGVKRALSLALEAVAQNPSIEMLGDIVHNEDVVRKVRHAGIKKISRLRHGTGKILLIRAHGATRHTINDAQKRGYAILDATCPMVHEIHTIARDMERKGYRIIIIGDTNHDEVKGIQGQLLRKPVIIDPKKPLQARALRRIPKAAVVVQSTQNIERVNEIVSELAAHIKQVRFHNTICAPTRLKQREIKKMPLQNEIIVVIGSKTSANTKRLYEISHSLNPRTYWVQAPADIDPRWFKHCRSVGITAGASTPEETIQAVADAVKKISR